MKQKFEWTVQVWQRGNTYKILEYWDLYSYRKSIRVTRLAKKYGFELVYSEKVKVTQDSEYKYESLDS